jgi:DNA-binding MarR family transcriptional regulator
MSDTELSLMETIYQADRSSERLTQRDLARSSGLSLGMTNALLKRLAERGLVKLTRVSAKSVRYALTAEGLTEIAHRTASYFRKASRDAERYRERIETFILETKRSGIRTVVLAGASEVDFLLEYVCERHGIVLVKSSDLERARLLGKRPGVMLVLSEKLRDTGMAASGTPATGVPGSGLPAAGWRQENLASVLAVSWAGRDGDPVL